MQFKLNSHHHYDVAWSYAALSHYPGDDFMRVAEIAMSHHAAFAPQGMTLLYHSTRDCLLIEYPDTQYSHTAVYHSHNTKFALDLRRRRGKNTWCFSYCGGER